MGDGTGRPTTPPAPPPHSLTGRIQSTHAWVRGPFGGLEMIRAALERGFGMSAGSEHRHQASGTGSVAPGLGPRLTAKLVHRGMSRLCRATSMQQTPSSEKDGVGLFAA